MLSVSSSLDQTAIDDDHLSSTQLSIPFTPLSSIAGDSKEYTTGKKMYSFNSRTQLSSKKSQVPKLKSKEVESTSKIRPSQVSDEPNIIKRFKVDSEVSSSDDDEKMDVVDKRAKPDQTFIRRVTRNSKKVISESETDTSEISEDEELALLAAKLNRGEAIGEVSENTLEDYFTAHSTKANMTSDHTLSKLARPKMDQQMVQSSLAQTRSSYVQECQALLTEYKSLYPYWQHLMLNGYNVLLYGLGSKLKLLEDFRKKHIKDACHLVVNGFFPGLTIKQVLNTLSSDLLGHSGSFKSHLEHASFICTQIEAKNEKGSILRKDLQKEVFLIIHNIDGSMLRGDMTQTALSLLAHSPSIHILASIDHINAPLCWDQRKVSKFNWLWHDVTSYELYRDETSYENSLLVRQSGTLALNSLTHVTKSLTPNARGIFELLVKYQLEHKTDSESIYLGMSFHNCYVKCREKFLVNSDMTLRAQLTEFRDHKLIRSRKGQDGVEYLYIPIDNGTLTQFLEQNID